LASLLPVDLSRQFWRPNINQAQVVARVQDLGMAHYRPILDRIEREFAKLTLAHPGVRIELTGEAIIESQAVQQVVKELFYSLALAAVIIFVVITIAVRSIRFGLLSVIPNIFPLVATGAMHACIDTSLDIASACSFAICLGIAVDDTIHFLMRFRHEREQGYDVESSIRRTFVTVGSALVMTTVVMVAGVGSVMTSELQTHFLFASMACATIGSALLGDLIILPALLIQFADRDTENPEPITEISEGAADA
jgi:predicted RND superfamily exporter protein